MRCKPADVVQDAAKQEKQSKEMQQKEAETTSEKREGGERDGYRSMHYIYYVRATLLPPQAKDQQ